MRGDVHRLRALRDVRGTEQRGSRYAVVVQSDDETHVLTEQTTAVAAERVGDLVGHVSLAELQAVDAALRPAIGLD